MVEYAGSFAYLKMMEMVTALGERAILVQSERERLTGPVPEPS